MPRKPRKPRAYLEPRVAQVELLTEIQSQFDRRRGMYESAGGNPNRMQGELTAYLPYHLLQAVFYPKETRTPRRAKRLP
jgi:hypothetical protein